MSKIAVIASIDSFLGGKLATYASEAGFRSIRTNKLDRILKELKQVGRLCIIDLGWEEVQNLPTLKQIINVGKIMGNRVVAMAPNQDEDLKKLAKVARVHLSFIRYDLEGSFRDYLKEEAMRPLGS